MAASASDVRAGGAFYEMSLKDDTAVALAKIQARFAVFGRLLAASLPTENVFGRLILGTKQYDAKTKEYLGRVGGLFGPIRAQLNKTLDSGENGAGILNRFLFGKKFFDAASKEYIGRVGGLVNRFHRMFDSGAGGGGLVNRFLFGAKLTDTAGQFVGRAGGIINFGKAVADTFRAAATSAGELGRMLRLIGGGMIGAGAAIGAPLIAFLTAGVERATRLVQLNRQLGVSIELLNKFDYAATKNGVSIDEVMQDKTGRYSKDIDEAPPVDPRDILAAAEAQRQLAEASRALQDALVPLAAALTPYLKLAAQWVKENAHLIAPALVLATVLVAVGAALVGAGLALGAVAAAAGALAAVWSTVVIIIGAAAWLTALAAGTAAVTYAFVTQTAAGRRMADTLEGQLVPAWETAKRSYIGFADALKQGNLEGAFRIAAAGMEAVWTRFTVFMESGWIGMTKDARDAWADFEGWFTTSVMTLEGWVEKAFVGIGDTISNFFKDIARTALLLIMQIGKGLAKLAENDPTGKLAPNIEAAIKELEKLKVGIGPNVDVDEAQENIDKRHKKEIEFVETVQHHERQARQAEHEERVAGLAKQLKDANDNLDTVIKEETKPRPEMKEHMDRLNLSRLHLDAEVKGTKVTDALGQQLGYGDRTGMTELTKRLVALAETNPFDTARALVPEMAKVFPRIW